jgi:hypothetical protein
MNRRLLSFVSLFLIMALMSTLVPTQIRLLEAQAQGNSVTTPVVSQEGPAGVEASVAQALASAPETAAATIVQSAQNVEFVGQVGGETDAVATQGSYAYIGVGQRLTILNISNPASPTTVGKTTQLGGIVLSVAVAGNYAYVAAGLRLHVVDVSNPSNPYEVGFYDTPGRAVTVAGSYAYVAATSQGLRVVNISTPSNPYEVGSYDTPGSAYDVFVAGSYAYVADMSSGLRVVNIVTPSAPYEVGFCDTPGGARSVAVAGSYAYIADGDQGLRVVNITNPSNPWEVGHWVTSWPYQMAWDVAVSGSYAYVAYSGAGLRVVNISVPSNPWEVGSYSPNISSGFALAVAISGSYAYIAYEYRGLQVANISSPSNPTGIGRYELLGWTNGVAVSGNYAYVADGYRGLVIMNVATPSNPTMVGACDLYGYAWDVVVLGGYAYVADGFAGGFKVVNVSNPSSPYIVASYYLPDDGATDVAVSGSYAYVTFGSRGLRVLNISSPSSPYEVGFYDTPGSAYGVALAGSYAYVADDTAGLRVVNISTPSHPYEVSFYDTPGSARGVAVAGGYAYVADGSTGLQIVNVSTPTNPSGVGVYDTPGDARGVAVAGSVAYVADYLTGGLRVLEVSSPSDPTEIGFYDSPNDAWGVSATEGLAYLADGRGGLLILRLPDMKIDAIEVTQGVQDLNNSVDLVATKRTYVRVHVSSSSTAYRVEADLSGLRNGAPLSPILSAGNPGQAITVRTEPDRGELSQSFWFELPDSWLDAGDLTLVARLDPQNEKHDPDPSNNTMGRTVSLQVTPPLRLNLVNVPYRVGGTTYQAADFHFDMLESWLRRAYPISDQQVTRQVFTYVESGVPDATLLNIRLAEARLFDLIFSDQDERVVYYGMVDDGGGFMRGMGILGGTTAAGPTGTMTWGWDYDGSYGDWYGAHEIAHTRNREHANFCGPTDGPTYPYPDGRISPTLTGNDALYGFDIEDRTIYDPNWHDLMTYCDNLWVSDFTYEGIRDYLVEVGQAEAQRQLLAANEFLVITGLVDLDTNTGELDSVYLIENTSEVSLPEPGDWVIALQDASGTDLITYAFAPLELTDAEEEPGSPAVIAAAVPTVPGLAQVEIRYLGSVVDARAMSANAPAVTITAPQPGQQLDPGPFTFAWVGYDPDDDPLTFTALYSSDNGTTWQTIASGIESQAFDLDVDLLPGGSESLLRVIASDGFLTGEAISGQFSVPLHSPQVEIISPDSNAMFWPDQLVVLAGKAYDLEDGQLMGAALEWASSLDGTLGTGELLSTVDLSMGRHTITLSVTDSDGMVTAVQRDITIGSGYSVFLPLIVRSYP